MDINLINVVTFAYLGDAVYELYVREHLINSGIAKVDNLQKEAIKYVSAKGQAKLLELLLQNEVLTDDEIEIIKRGRNNKKHSHPKNTDAITYKISTGFECLIGYLYLNKNMDRLEQIMNYVLGGNYEKNN